MARSRSGAGEILKYRADHAGYPENLDALTPKYISAIPKDRYNEQSLHFTRTADGYLLYSVGTNGIDDHGRTSDSDPASDDIVLELPIKTQKKR